MHWVITVPDRWHLLSAYYVPDIVPELNKLSPVAARKVVLPLFTDKDGAAQQG